METESTPRPLSPVQDGILRYLRLHGACYARPVSSQRLAQVFRASPAYIRQEASDLVRSHRLRVRRGKGGGYYLDGP
ncbi:MAG: Rrf2 family transcriptional regulator [Firmicutes bacterium]|uniref:Rrf2 family transcriptional regulator n=1 Tax=Geochorda subterranea TaxID=3109564 RepID=A0ABZ1BTY8_9FIRM|nr:Rrf2 family transcriptional regulator [Limnochorda sp. LNt]NLG68398.1 Rrf2 family transcriptional regulator [Bacillota bacterium]WRP15628.1 Rrf2 family transcriptional regulator [Limnochorda sp. LNt]